MEGGRQIRFHRGPATWILEAVTPMGVLLVSPTAYEPSKPAAGVSLAPGPLFVVSMWRSGASLLYALLNKHPQVALTYEADLWLLRSVFHKPALFATGLRVGNSGIAH